MYNLFKNALRLFDLNVTKNTSFKDIDYEKTFFCFKM